jgi:hypothetical protein
MLVRTYSASWERYSVPAILSLVSSDPWRTADERRDTAASASAHRFPDNGPFRACWNGSFRGHAVRQHLTGLKLRLCLVRTSKHPQENRRRMPIDRQRTYRCGNQARVGNASPFKVGNGDRAEPRRDGPACETAGEARRAGLSLQFASKRYLVDLAERRRGECLHNCDAFRCVH